MATAKNTQAAQVTATPQAPSFFETLTAIAKPVTKLSNAQAQQDPKLALRTRFQASVAEQQKLIKSAAGKSRWFIKNPDDSYVLTLRNGNTALAINGTTYFAVPDAATAVKFLDTVIEGTKAGELDEVLAATLRKPRAKKEAQTPDAK